MRRRCATSLGRAENDPVARFHLGTVLEQLNYGADRSDKGMAQSGGLMVNYLYTESGLSPVPLSSLKQPNLMSPAAVAPTRSCCAASAA